MGQLCGYREYGYSGGSTPVLREAKFAGASGLQMQKPRRKGRGLAVLLEWKGGTPMFFLLLIVILLFRMRRLSIKIDLRF